MIILAVAAAFVAHLNGLQSRRSLLTTYRARQGAMVRQLPAVVPESAVICLAGGTATDAAIAVGGDLFRALRHDAHLGFVVPATTGSPPLVSYGAGYRTLSGRPVVAIQLGRAPAKC